jgi:hypothetical protein
MTVKKLLSLLVIIFICHPLSVSAGGKTKHLYLCRSPLLAFNFWESLINIQRQGVTLTPTIAEEICNGMRAGSEPQCIRVEGDNFKPIASGWGGALAMTDGTTRIWFHHPDTGGWIHPDYYVNYINSPPR